MRENRVDTGVLFDGTAVLSNVHLHRDQSMTEKKELINKDWDKYKRGCVSVRNPATKRTALIRSASAKKIPERPLVALARTGPCLRAHSRCR